MKFHKLDEHVSTGIFITVDAVQFEIEVTHYESAIPATMDDPGEAEYIEWVITKIELDDSGVTPEELAEAITKIDEASTGS